MAKTSDGIEIKSAEPSQLPPSAATFSRAWNDLDRLRIEAYRIALPAFAAELVQAVRDGDREQLNAIQMRADREWTQSMGVPALTPDKLEIVMAAVSAANFPATDAGLIAWTESKMKSRSSDLLEFDEIVTLSGVGKKTVQTVVSAWRKAGNQIKYPCSYELIRPLLLKQWPDRKAAFSEHFADVRSFLDQHPPAEPPSDE